MSKKLFHKISWFNSVQAKFSIILLLTTTIIFGGFILTYYNTTKTGMYDDLGELATLLCIQLSKSLVMPLWDMELRTIEGIMDASMNEKQVYAIVVRTDTGSIYNKIRNDQWVSVNSGQISFKPWHIRRQGEVVRKNKKLGIIEIYLTPEFVQKRLREAVLNMLITLVILNILLFMMLFFSIRKTVVTPVREISEYLRRLSAGNLPDPMTNIYSGEFNEIRNSLNMLIEATNQTALAAESIAAGNLDIDVIERSEHDRMMQALNRMIQRLNGIMKETNGMIQAVGHGKLDIRGNAEAFEGGWHELVTGVNHLIDGLSSAVSEKAALGMEMELAKKIQTVLLPKKPEIFGYEIAASMSPAEEVGGDYYDVISVGGFDWIVIGDVSGHGVTAGLVMMMVQTSIHTVLIQNPQVPTARLLSVINQAIYENLVRMDESKHMTIVVLACGKDGFFDFSGLHDDILLWCAESRKVETIKTDGMWIGLEPDISDMLTTDEFRLETGDCIVLFTDGVTEAWGKDGKMFGEERLIKIVESAGGKSAAEIHGAILEELKPYDKPDDVTLLVMKRL